MIDPLYLTLLPSIEFTAIEIRYFFEKLKKDNLANSNCLTLASFIVSQAGKKLPSKHNLFYYKTKKRERERYIFSMNIYSPLFVCVA